MVYSTLKLTEDIEQKLGKTMQASFGQVLPRLLDKTAVLGSNKESNNAKQHFSKNED